MGCAGFGRSRHRGNKNLEAVFAAKAGLLGHGVFTMDTGGIDDLMRAGAHISDELIMERATSVRPSDLATLIYTSGTTGLPKGCALRAADLVFTARSVLSVMGDVINETAVTLLFLPLAHSFARLAQVGCIIAGCRIAFSSGPTHLMDELMECDRRGSSPSRGCLRRSTTPALRMQSATVEAASFAWRAEWLRTTPELRCGMGSRLRCDFSICCSIALSIRSYAVFSEVV